MSNQELLSRKSCSHRYGTVQVAMLSGSKLPPALRARMQDGQSNKLNEKASRGGSRHEGVVGWVIHLSLFIFRLLPSDGGPWVAVDRRFDWPEQPARIFQ